MELAADDQSPDGMVAATGPAVKRFGNHYIRLEVLGCLGGVVVRASDLLSRDREFDSRRCIGWG